MMWLRKRKYQSLLCLIPWWDLQSETDPSPPSCILLENQLYIKGWAYCIHQIQVSIYRLISKAVACKIFATPSFESPAIFSTNSPRMHDFKNIPSKKTFTRCLSATSFLAWPWRITTCRWQWKSSSFVATKRPFSSVIWRESCCSSFSIWRYRLTKNARLLTALSTRRNNDFLSR